MQIDTSLKPADLLPRVNRVLELASKKVRAIDKRWDPAHGTPVFTVEGKYTTRGWTEWTQGFQYGSALLCFDGTDDRELLELGRSRTVERMAPHVTHTGVHDHGFNNISTYGNLRRLMREGRFEHNEWEMKFYEMALKASGAVQAARWTHLKEGWGFIYSFNGPHSLFIDTLRSLRSLVLAHQLGHKGMDESDQAINLLERAVAHAVTTAKYLIFDGSRNHAYEVIGRTAHEGIFNCNDSSFRCRSTQQGYSPFSTWTRGLAWALLGYAEQLEFLKIWQEPGDNLAWARFVPHALRPKYLATPEELTQIVVKEIVARYSSTCVSVANHFLRDTVASDGIPYWDDGAPGLAKLGDWRDRPAEPFNDHEPVDSSAAAIAAQGLIRLGAHLGEANGKTYFAAGLTVARTLFDEPYLSTSDKHEGLILHSVYHRPNGWDHIPKGRKVPCGESSMWGDYHAIELAVLIQRLALAKYMTFFDR